MTDLGIRFAVVNNGKIYDAASLRASIFETFEILMRGHAAHEYVEKLAGRVKDSYADRLKQARIDNTPVTTVGPAWLRPIPYAPWWEPVPERMRLIREIFDLTIAGHAPWGIARMFNDRGEISFGGRKWERTAIVKIVRNRAIEGDYVVGEGKNQKPTGEVLVGYYGKPVIPLDVVAQARAMLDRRRRGKGRNSGAINNLFGQMIRCGECDGRMMLVGYQSRYLVCYEAMRGGGCNHRSSYRYRPFEAAALDAVLHFALDETFFRQAKKASNLGLEIEEVEKAIRDKTAEAGRMVDLLARIDSPTTEAKLVEAEAYITALKAQLAGQRAQLAAAHGVASAEAHLGRVGSVREALHDPDDEIRLPARLRVCEALQAVTHSIKCEGVDGVRRFELVLMGGAYAVRFDNEGRKLAEVHGDLRAIIGERNGAARDLVRRVNGGKAVEPHEPLSGEGPYTFFPHGRDRPLQRRIRRHPRYSIRLRGQAGHRPARQAARDRPRSRSAAGARQAGDHLPAR